MKTLTVSHETTYLYNRPVGFGEHHLMFRPRDSHDIRLVDARLTVSPPAKIRWYHDVFSNSITIATFDRKAAELYLASTIVIEHYGAAMPEFPIEPFAQTLPFAYPAEDIPDLGRTIERHYPDRGRKVDSWVRQFLNDEGPTETHDFLLRLTQAIKADFTYVERSDPGIQVPVETLKRRAGSCRDFALLMMEAVRSLGLAARFVTGYVYDPALDGADSTIVGSGATHAWVQVYLPGAGWVEFDPTNGVVGGPNLIRVGVARDPSQAIPVKGTYVGEPGDFREMKVDVKVTAKTGPQAETVLGTTLR